MLSTIKNVMPVILEEIPDDYEAIRELNRLAFSGNEEAELVDRFAEHWTRCRIPRRHWGR